MLKNHIAIALLACGMLFAAGCGSAQKLAIAANATVIEVEFQDDVSHVQAGDRVLLMGVQIGETKKPFVLRGRAIVPVALQNIQVLDDAGRAYFLLAPDPSRPERRCLLARTYPTAPNPGQPRFRGFTSLVKLNVQLAKDGLRSSWKDLLAP